MKVAEVYEYWDCPTCGKTSYPQADAESGTCINCGEEFELNRIGD